jgi:aspartate/methionine/tyrosine aminotransferase
MRIDPFKLERYFAQYEFTTPFMLSCSDCDGLDLNELLVMADGESRAMWDGLRLGYTESPGRRPLREEIAGLYEDVTPDQVLVGAPEELIFIAINTLVKNGDHVVCTFPGYQSLYQIAEALHCEVAHWEPDDGAGWRFDPGRLEELIRPSTRLLVVNFPHNPTGALVPRADFERIVEIARRHDLPLLSDEMYRGLELDPADQVPAAAELYEHGLSLSGMSKVYGLAGLRIGWIVCREERLYKRMAGLKDYTTVCSSTPGEVLALMGLRARQAIVLRHLSRIERNLELLTGLFDKYKALFEWQRPRGGTVCFPRLVPPALSVDDHCRLARTEAGVLLAPSSVFDYGDRHIRFGFGREDLPEVIAHFDGFLASKRASG